MKAISLNFWHKCNNKCIFCFCREKDLIKEKITPPVIHSLRELGKFFLKYKLNCDLVIFSGNEPTLNPKLLPAVLLAKKIGYQVEIRTNGRYLKDKNFCKKLLMVGIDQIGITVLSHKNKIHDFLTQRVGSFKETIKGIKNLVKLGLAEKIRLYSVINKFNYKHLPESLLFYYKLGIKNIRFNFVYHNNPYIVPKLSDLKKYLVKCLSLANKRKIFVLFYGIPLCVLGEKYKKFISEFYLKNELILGGRISDYFYLRKKMGKRKTKYCKKCYQNNICEGTWKSYYNIYGEEEFKKWAKKYD